MRAMERRGGRGEEDREEERGDGKRTGGTGEGRAVDGNRDTVLAVSHMLLLAQ